MTWLELRDLWDERDARYQLRRKVPLSDRQRTVIRSFRLGEIEQLPVQDRWRGVEAMRVWR